MTSAEGFDRHDPRTGRPVRLNGLIERLAAGEGAVGTFVSEEEGVDNIREILQVPGIGAVFVGEVDLAVSQGYPGAPEAPAFRG